jgi:hypothetical protein
MIFTSSEVGRRLVSSSTMVLSMWVSFAGARAERAVTGELTLDEAAFSNGEEREGDRGVRSPAADERCSLGSDGVGHFNVMLSLLWGWRDKFRARFQLPRDA